MNSHFVFCFQTYSKVSSLPQQQNFQGSERLTRVPPPNTEGWTYSCIAKQVLVLPDSLLTVTLERALMLHGPSVNVYDVGMSPFKMNHKGQLIMSNAYIMHIYAYIKQ